MAQTDQTIFFGQSASSEFHIPDGTLTDNASGPSAAPTQGAFNNPPAAAFTAFDKIAYPSGLGLSRISNPA